MLDCSGFAATAHSGARRSRDSSPAALRRGGGLDARSARTQWSRDPVVLGQSESALSQPFGGDATVRTK
eukprot:483448-Prymnesium_polylepis.1